MSKSDDVRRGRYERALKAGLPSGNEQLELFRESAATTPDKFTNQFHFFDLIPKFTISPMTSATVGERLKFVEFEFDWGQVRCRATIAPVVVVVRDPSGANGAKQKDVLPGPREALVYRVLRKMFSEHAQRLVQQGDRVLLVTTLYGIRKRLETVGHGMTIDAIREALEILSTVNLRVTNVASGKELFSDGYIHLDYVSDPKDETGERSLVNVAFNRHAVTAILHGLYDRIHYERLMSLQRPLAAWIYELLTRNFRQAGTDYGYRLSMSRILRESGMTVRQKFRSNVEQVRAALEELTERGVLRYIGGYKETVQYGEAPLRGGRRAIREVVWELFPSDEVVDDIRSDNAAQKARRTETLVGGDED